MAGLADISVKLGLDIADFQKGLQNAEKTMQTAGKNIANVGKKLTTAVTLPVAAIGVGAIKVGADFEKSMAKVSAVTGASEKDFSALETKARDLGSSTKYSANEVADAMGFLGMAGFKTNDILDATEGMLTLASVSGMDLASTADIASNMLTGMGMEAGEMGKVVDTMAYAMANSNVDIGMLGESFKYVAPVASSLGVDLDELTATIGFLGDAGIQGGMAGTSLSTGLNRLAKPSKEASTLMKELGIEAWDAEGNLKSLPAIVAELEDGFKDLNPREQAEAMAIMFGLESVKSWSTLVARGSDELAEFSGEIEGATGKGQEMADIMNDTLYGALDNLKSTIDDVGISIYKELEEPLKKVIEWITKAVEWFGNLSTESQVFAMAIAGISAIIPPLLIVFGFMISAIGKIIGVVKMAIDIYKNFKLAINLTKIVGLVTNPIGWIILAVTSLIAIGVAVWKNWETVKEKAVEIWTAISDFFVETWAIISEGVKTFLSTVNQWFFDGWSKVKETTVSVFNSVIDFLVEWGLKLYEASGMKAFVAYMKENWKFIKDTISITLEMIMAIIKVIWSKIWGWLKPHLDRIANFISKTWNKVKEFTSKKFNEIRDFIVKIWNKVYGEISKFVGKIWSKISEKWNEVYSTTSELFTKAKDKVTEIFGKMQSKVSEISNKIKNKISEKFQEAKDKITEPIEDAKEFVKDMLDEIKGFFDNLKLKIPKPSLPKVSVKKGSADFMGASIPVPKFSVSWNAKGGIFDGATLLGGGQGVGEAGAEAVLPIQHKRYMKPFASSIAEHLDKDKGKGTGDVHNEFKIAQLVVREEADVMKIAERLEKIQRKEQRAKGVFAY